MLFRIALKFTNQVVDIAIKRCREQQCLASARDGAHDALYCWHKAHVGHAVCFVNHHECDCTQIEIATLHQVFQTTRCCNDDACSTSSLHLWSITSAAVNSSNSDATTCAQHRHFFCYLSSKLACWHKHQTVWTTWLGLHNFDSQRNTECKRFARSSWCLATNI